MNRSENTPTLADRLDRLKSLITDLEEGPSLDELKRMLEQGVDPKTLLACCMEAMHQVGVRFEQGVYFISALIMAGEIMRSATDLLSPYLAADQSSEGKGRIMLGTIQGDIHDLGKNLFALLLRCHGISVIDLGVDVSAETFLEAAKAQRPDIIGISCVLTNSVEALKHAVEFLDKNLPSPKIPTVIGGTCVDERVAAYVGATLWANDATNGLRICQRILAETGL